MTIRLIRKPAITLLELLIVIAIIATVSGFIAINVTKAVRQQRFRSEVSRVVDEMRLAQDLMLILGVGATLKFEVRRGGDGIDYWLETSLPLPKHWEAMIHKESPALKAIQVIQFQDSSEEGKLEIKFLSPETGMSKGLLRLSTNERDDDLGAFTSYICLPGYPSPIEYKIGGIEGAFCEQKENEEFMKTLSRHIYEQINDLQANTTENETPKNEEKESNAD
ncbi:MAG: hypothetical protein AAGG81_06630 [Chlamydiota bacterium]